MQRPRVYDDVAGGRDRDVRVDVLRIRSRPRASTFAVVSRQLRRLEVRVQPAAIDVCQGHAAGYWEILDQRTCGVVPPAMFGAEREEVTIRREPDEGDVRRGCRPGVRAIRA